MVINNCGAAAVLRVAVFQQQQQQQIAALGRGIRVFGSDIFTLFFISTGQT
jgi:hypothetical protein